MPGSTHELPAGAMCDQHGDRPAVRRLQGETDSFGCEYVDMCQECLDEHRRFIEAERDRPRFCDWCKKEKHGVRPHRDIDEGMAGPVYDVCTDCIRKENKRLHEELEDYGRYEY
jgi:hypothetical protein